MQCTIRYAKFVALQKGRTWSFLLPPLPSPPADHLPLSPYPPKALRNPGMRERHWTLLSEQLGTPLHPGKDFTLVKAEAMQLLQHLEVITKVADVAGKEFSIEQVGGAEG